ncbi:kinesin-like protein KIF25, partial [Carlito syrichta]|uniref:Kinesin-like protein n=1 Tax=Carlito syrichta TaxID=1868482 RepID=A0A1U7SKG8_CARSF
LISEDPSRSSKVDVSIVEVYNNDIFDLLAKDSSTAGSGVKREVMTTKAGRKEVALLTQKAVGSAAELVRLVWAGQQLRAQHPTLVHAESSRSHLIITVTLTTAPGSDGTGKPTCPQPQPTVAGRTDRSRSMSPGASPLRPIPKDPTGHSEKVWARLQLVDLAGSECVGKSGVTGVALRETACINRSLAALADVLGALSERRGHVPYRNSRLTHFLQEAIGGDAKLLVILCVSPSRKHVAQTLQSLSFGTRARQVERGRAGRRPPHSRTEERAAITMARLFQRKDGCCLEFVFPYLRAASLLLGVQIRDGLARPLQSSGCGSHSLWHVAKVTNRQCLDVKSKADAQADSPKQPYASPMLWTRPAALCQPGAQILLSLSSRAAHVGQGR